MTFSITIAVPATSANVAVGFDTLGLALNYRATFIFSQSSQHLEISGTEAKYQTSNNLAYRAFAKGCEYLEQPVPNIKIDMDKTLPISRGLGSSATCIVAGLVAAGKWYKQAFNNQELIKLATEMEGHPDNVVPAILGGLQLSFIDDNNQPQVVSYHVADNLRLIAMIPNYKVNTDEARKILPTSLNYADAIHQVSHFGILIHGLESGNLAEIKLGMEDRMHEPYRSTLIPEFNQAKQIVNSHNGALYISGSGPTLMAIFDSHIHSKAFSNIASDTFSSWQIRPVEIDATGVQSEDSKLGKVLYR